MIPLSRMALAAVPLALTLGVLELGFRVYDGWLAGPPRPYIRPDHLLGWTNVPDHEHAVDTDEFRTVFRTNSLGLPDVERTLKPAAGVKRVLVLGDSFVAAMQVDRERRSPALIERALAERSRDTVEVINSGVNGYQTDQELIFYESIGHRFRPDVVLLFLVVSGDVMGNVTSSGSFSTAVVKPRFRLVDGRLALDPMPSGGELASDPWGQPATAPQGALDTVKDWLYRNSALYQTLADAWYRARQRIGPPAFPEAWLVFRTAGGGRVDEAWAVTQALLARLRDRVAADGAGFGVVVVPDRFEVETGAWETFLAGYGLDADEWDAAAPHRQIERVCREERIPCLDLLPGLRTAGGGMYFPRDGHFTEKAHRLVADLTLEWMERVGLDRALIR